jgi:uncharacterized protein (DUF4415 family)
MKNGNNTKRRSRTDWKRIDSLRDEDIDISDIPKQGADFFARAILWPGPKKQITLRLDPDVLAFFRKTRQGLSDHNQRGASEIRGEPAP